MSAFIVRNSFIILIMFVILRRGGIINMLIKTAQNFIEVEFFYWMKKDTEWPMLNLFATELQNVNIFVLHSNSIMGFIFTHVLQLLWINLTKPLLWIKRVYQSAILFVCFKSVNKEFSLYLWFVVLFWHVFEWHRTFSFIVRMVG